MKSFQMITNTLFAVGCALLVGTKSFAEPMNLDVLKAEIKTYQSSGQYDKEFASVVAEAQAFITSRVAANQKAKPPLKLALVLDIDETSLSNYNNILARDFCNNSTQISKEMSHGDDPALSPMLALYKNALTQGVAVFFITGRPETLNKDTVQNLKSAGYAGWAGLYFRPATDKQPSVTPFKTQARTAITHAGYTIIASIGDQQSDLDGGLAEKTFKLPNPFYFLH